MTSLDAVDYTSITELPGSGLSPEQWARIHHRYGVALQHAQDRRVLEVACGAGVGLPALSQVAQQVVGGDYSAAPLAAAQSALQPLFTGNNRHVPGALTQFDAQRLPFAPGSFDLLLLFEAIYYLHRPELFLDEARRTLAPNGALLVGTENPDWPAFIPGKLSTRYWNIPQLATLLAQSGFKEIQCFGAFSVAAYSSRQKWLARLRRALVTYGLIPNHPWLRRALQRMGHGRLTALPANLEVTALHQPPLTPLPIHTPNIDYKVFYLYATRI